MRTVRTITSGCATGTITTITTSNNNNRRGQNPMTRVFESNGPDIKIRGTASHVARKNTSSWPRRPAALAIRWPPRITISTPALFSPDRRRPEQFVRTSRSRAPRMKCLRRTATTKRELFEFRAGGPVCPGAAASRSYAATTLARPAPAHCQPYQPREQHRPATTAAIASIVRSRSSPRHNLPVIPDSVSRRSPPSFITGPQPQINAARRFEGGERFPRRRRRPRRPTPRWPARAVTPSDDFNTGNE